MLHSTQTHTYTAPHFCSLCFAASVAFTSFTLYPAVCVWAVHRERELWHYFMYNFSFFSYYFVLQQRCYSAVRLPLPVPLSVESLYFCLAASYIQPTPCLNWLLYYCNSFVTHSTIVLTMLKFISEHFVFCCNGLLSGHFITFFLFMQHCKLYVQLHKLYN